MVLFWFRRFQSTYDTDSIPLRANMWFGMALWRAASHPRVTGRTGGEGQQCCNIYAYVLQVSLGQFLHISVVAANSQVQYTRWHL